MGPWGKGVLVVVLTLLVWAPGCGDDDDDEPSTAGADASELVGTFSREVTDADLERTEDIRTEAAGQQRPPAGTYELTFSADDLTATDPDGVSVAELYAVEDPGTLTTGAYLENAFCGPEIPLEAEYTWTIEDSNLELAAVDDPCADRDSILTGTWTAD